MLKDDVANIFSPRSTEEDRDRKRFGEDIGVESLIAKTAEEIFDEFLELGNGCICCLHEMSWCRRWRDFWNAETSSITQLWSVRIGNPGKLANVFWLDDELESRMYLDAIVTVVDAKNVERHLDERVPTGDSMLKE